MKNSILSNAETVPATWGVIVGRFQTPELHAGHRCLIDEVRRRHAKVLMLIGVTPANPTLRNPLDYETRKLMLEAVYGKAQITFAPIRDCKEDSVWYKQLETMIAELTGGESLCLYGSRDSFLDQYKGAYPTCRLDACEGHSATLLRNQAAEAPQADAAFRAGVIYATAQRFPQVYPTVDIAIFRQNRQQILLGRKPLETLFRFPGGFVDATDSSFEAAALREAKEECGELKLENVQYKGSVKVDDWRYRNSPDAIFTSLFTADCTGGEAQASDDLAEVRWFDVSTLNPEQLVSEHQKLFFLMVNDER